jgi:hypothetical protein
VTVRRTELAIEHLVLEGARQADARVVGEALERELARLVHVRGAPDARAASVGDVLISIDAQADESPAALGARLAHAIYGRLQP